MIGLAVLAGAIVGFVLGLVGGGGSILALPLLLYVVGYEGDPHVAIGTTALAVAASAFANALQHRREGNLRLRAGLWFALPGVAAAWWGARLGLRTDAEPLLFLFALLMLVVAWRMWRSEEPRARRRPGRFRRRWVAASGTGVGFLSGFFGIGGGFLAVPALARTAKLGVREAIGTSLVAVTAFGLATAGRYAIAGQIDLPLALVFVAGGVVGGVAGTRLGARVDKARLRRIFALTLVPVAIYMMARAGLAMR